MKLNADKLLIRCYFLQESGFPLYHTTYATFNNVKKFLDPDFMYHQAVSRFVTEMMRSLADSIIIPFITQDYAIRLQEVYRKLLENTEIINRLSAQNLQDSLGVCLYVIMRGRKSLRYNEERNNCFQ